MKDGLLLLTGRHVDVVHAADHDRGHAAGTGRPVLHGPLAESADHSPIWSVHHVEFFHRADAGFEDVREADSLLRSRYSRWTSVLVNLLIILIAMPFFAP